VPSSQRWTFFTIAIIYSDLNKEQKELINNYYSKKIKLVSFLYGLMNRIQDDLKRIRSRSCIYNFFII
jgi:hypothetical protein